MGGLGDEWPDQIRYRVGEEGEHVWAYPRCRVATRRVWISGGASSTARSPSELASRRRCQVTVLLEFDPAFHGERMLTRDTGRARRRTT